MFKLIANLSRLITGIVFIFSGFVKVVDPLGSAYKFTDYFVAMHLNFMADFSLPMAIIMCTAELLIGLMLLFNLLPKLASWGLLLFMVMFTPLTLWLAIANPVHDCGCFGDALILSNWATFAKNLVLLTFTIVVFIYRKKFSPLFSRSAQWVFSVLFGIFGVSICFYALMHLPPIDFRPYRIGANIQEGMTIPESEQKNVDVYESTFIYEKDGVKKEFTLENLPDSTWKFVDANHKLIKKGYEPPIHDFTITPVILKSSEIPDTDEAPDVYDAMYTYEKDGELIDYSIDELPGSEWTFVEVKSHYEIDPSMVEIVYQDANGESYNYTLDALPGEGYQFIDAYYTGDETSTNFDQSSGEITDLVLDNDGYTFFLISVDILEANTKNHEQINKLAAWCETKGYTFMCLTGSSAVDVEKFITENHPVYSFYNTDPITLKTIIRSNPGLVLIKHGTVLNKWAYRDIPDIKELERDLTAYSLDAMHTKKARNMVHNFIFVGLLIMTLAMWVQHYSKYRRRR